MRNAMWLDNDMSTTHTFQTGQSYQARSACDHDCVWTFTVTARTAKFVTLVDELTGETFRVGVKTSTYGESHEYALPFGTYSMAPTISADRAMVPA